MDVIWVACWVEMTELIMVVSKVVSKVDWKVEAVAALLVFLRVEMKEDEKGLQLVEKKEDEKVDALVAW